MVSIPWITAHWLDLFQSIGIIGGLFFTGFSLQIDAKVRRVQNLLKITEQHRELWSRLYDNEELQRVVSEDPDLKTRQITFDEELFVLSVILHLNSVYNAMR